MLIALSYYSALLSEKLTHSRGDMAPVGQCLASPVAAASYGGRCLRPFETVVASVLPFQMAALV
jgi:hypothetical protein